MRDSAHMIKTFGGLQPALRGLPKLTYGYK
jgi:hypothetical protein